MGKVHCRGVKQLQLLPSLQQRYISRTGCCLDFPSSRDPINTTSQHRGRHVGMCYQYWPHISIKTAHQRWYSICSSRSPQQRWDGRKNRRAELSAERRMFRLKADIKAELCLPAFLFYVSCASASSKTTRLTT